MAYHFSWVAQVVNGDPVPVPRKFKRDFLPEDLLPELRANYMDGSVAVQADQSEQETMFLLDLAGRFSGIKGVVGWVDLCSPELPQRLEYFSRFERLCGFRHVVQSEPDDRYMLRKDFLAGIGSLQRFKFTYDILIYPQQLLRQSNWLESFLSSDL